MMEFLAEHQLNFMLALSGICIALALLLSIAKALSRRRRVVLILMELVATSLIYFDRLAYIYSGDVSRTGYVMVRLSNFIVFFMTAGIVFAFDMYIYDLLTDEGRMEKIPTRVRVVGILSVIEMVMVVISQFTGMYYYFDEANRYHRGPLFLLCYVIPVVGPLILFTVIRQYRRLISRLIYISLLLFIFVPIISAIIQIWAYGLSLVNIAMVFVAVFLYVFAYLDLNEKVERANQIELEYLREGQSRAHRMFDQTARAFVGAVDARSIYTHGHSERVATYAKKLAEMAGKSEDECHEVYYAALLHDIARIELPDSILEKGRDVTGSEKDVLMQQPVIGNQILSGISEFPYLSVGAHYHQERFDGTGYPERLKGENIPEVARIVAVANLYDELSSKNRYRDPLPQQVVREEFIKESGNGFDPKYASLMVQLIDTDANYQLKEENENVDAIIHSEFTCDEYRSVVSYGIPVTSEVTRISFLSEPTDTSEGKYHSPAIIIFDSLDSRVHDTERAIQDTRYIEYGEMWFDGRAICTEARNMETNVSDDTTGAISDNEYIIETARYKDHLRIRLINGKKTTESVIALEDSSRFAYIALTGENCHICEINIEKTGESVGENDIPRIADEISYINRLESDLPNIQIEAFRQAATEGVRVKDGTKLVFHTMSLPAANLVWHCPSVILFYSDDKKINGPNYREYAFIRFDGEEQEASKYAENDLTTVKSDDFKGWEEWKKINKKGYECEISFSMFRKTITTTTENNGISIKNVTVIKDGTKEIYAALTGDQCALTDIRVM